MYRKIFKQDIVENYDDGHSEELQQSYTDYIQAFRNIHHFLNDIGVEWWPVEGTLIGLLRLGNVFGNIGQKIVISDSDIDIFVRFDKDEDWDAFKTNVNHFLVKEKSFTECKHGIDNLVKFDGKNNKYKCHTDKYVPGDCDICDDDIHIDFHRYIVNESENMVYMHDMCKDGTSCLEKYPFQKWNGYVRYKGFIVDENKKFLKTKCLDMDINCPYKFLELLSDWNDNEYGDGSDIHIPRGNCIYDKNTKEIHNDNTFSNKELKMMCEYGKYLHDQGYASFFSKWGGKCH